MKRNDIATNAQMDVGFTTEQLPQGPRKTCSAEVGGPTGGVLPMPTGDQAKQQQQQTEGWGRLSKRQMLIERIDHRELVIHVKPSDSFSQLGFSGVTERFQSAFERCL